MQIVGNFVFLGVAYFVGVGISSLLYRIGPGRAKRRAETGVPESGHPDASVASGTAPDAGSLWIELPPAPRDKDAWLRPF